MSTANHVSTHFGILPSNVGQLIVEEAALSDYKTAQTLALVSKYARTWSERGRYSRVEIQTVKESDVDSAAKAFFVNRARVGTTENLTDAAPKVTDGPIEQFLERLKQPDAIGRHVRHLGIMYNAWRIYAKSDSVHETAILREIISLCPNILELGLDFGRLTIRLPEFPPTLTMLSCSFDPNVGSINYYLHPGLIHLELTVDSLQWLVETSSHSMREAAPLLSMLVFNVHFEESCFFEDDVLMPFFDFIEDAPAEWLCVLRMSSSMLMESAIPSLETALVGDLCDCGQAIIVPTNFADSERSHRQDVERENAREWKERKKGMWYGPEQEEREFDDDCIISSQQWRALEKKFPPAIYLPKKGEPGPSEAGRFFSDRKDNELGREPFWKRLVAWKTEMREKDSLEAQQYNDGAETLQDVLRGWNGRE